jgi:hypothetical protein
MQTNFATCFFAKGNFWLTKPPYLYQTSSQTLRRYTIFSTLPDQMNSPFKDSPLSKPDNIWQAPLESDFDSTFNSVKSPIGIIKSPISISAISPTIAKSPIINNSKDDSFTISNSFNSPLVDNNIFENLNNDISPYKPPTIPRNKKIQQESDQVNTIKFLGLGSPSQKSTRLLSSKLHRLNNPPTNTNKLQYELPTRPRSPLFSKLSLHQQNRISPMFEEISLWEPNCDNDVDDLDCLPRKPIGIDWLNVLKDD